MIAFIFYGYPIVIAVLLLCSIDIPEFLKNIAIIIFILDVLDFVIEIGMKVYLDTLKKKVRDLEKRRKEGYD